MEVTFQTQRLQRCYEDINKAIQRWGEPVAKKYVNRVNSLRAAGNFRMIYQMRAFRLHPLKGSRRGDLSIYLVGRWRMIVRQGNSEEHVIIAEVSNHYGD